MKFSDLFARRFGACNVLLWLFCIAGMAKAQQGKPAVAESYGKLPLSFEANQGQTDPHVMFLSRGSGYSLFLTRGEAVLALGKGIANQTSTDKTSPIPAEGAVLQMKLLGANTEAPVSGMDELPGKTNYFIGDDPKLWRTYVPTYARVKYSGVYPGVDLLYYGNQRQLESDFVVAPNAEPRRIVVEIKGADRLSIDGQGDLVTRSGYGTVRLKKPVAYQEVGGARKEVAAGYRLKGKNRVVFDLAPYDRAKPLVIDPVLAYSTYLGGSGGDEGEHIAVDAAGSAYVTGFTVSVDFPTTFGAFQTVSGGTQFGNAFVTKLSPDGSSLVYSTYLGGNGGDSGMSVAVDSSGNAYVTGFTNSNNFPTTLGAFQRSHSGSNRDAFVTKLNAAGSGLVYSTYLAGSGTSPAGCAGAQGNGIAVDSAGSAYVAGVTNYPDFPTTAGAFQTTLHGNQNAFVTKLNAAGSALVYSTYIGGSGGGCSADIGNGIAVDASGAAYITGRARSIDFPTTAGAFQTSRPGTIDSAFVTKLSVDGSALVYSTYLGGSDGGGDTGQSIAVDSAGSAYVTGLTGATTFPTTPGAFQRIYGGGNDDAFVTKLSADGSALIYSTYLGGNGIDQAFGIAVDSFGVAYVTGLTQSTNFPTSAGAFQTTLTAPAGSNNAFMSKLRADGSGLFYSTYLGGSSGEQGTGIAVDSTGSAYVTGVTTSTNFPTTTGAFQTTLHTTNGNANAFVTKIATVQSPTSTALTVSANPTDVGDSITFTAAVSSANGTPVGSVTFLDGSTTLAVVTLSSGQASFTTSGLAAGAHNISAQFTPNDPTSFAASSSSLTETIFALSQIPLLNGNNTFSGNQTVNGSVSASAFFGNGAGLTNVIASGLNCAGCIGNAQLGINYAAGDAQGGNALNALLFGGLPPGAFAPATGSGNYVAKAGDTMTGTLNVPANGLAAGTNQLVLSGGNVGIGTATPQSTLDVTGLGSFGGSTDNSGTEILHVQQSGVGTSATFHFDLSQPILPQIAPTAIRGDALATTNFVTHGVTGTSMSSNGRGVAGLAISKTGETRGVNAVSLGDSGEGIAAFELSPSGSTLGIYALSSSPQGIGGQFENSAGGQILSGLNHGVEKFRVDGNGSVTAGAFFGNGAGLTNVNASSAGTASSASSLTCTGCVGNAQLGINYAAGDAQGGNALNALMLGGLAPGAFAPAAGSANYVAKAGDTMTGTLNLPSNGLVAGGSQLVIVGPNANFNRDAIGFGTASPKADLHLQKSLHGQAAVAEIENTGPFSAATLELKALSFDNANDWSLVAQDNSDGTTQGFHITNAAGTVALAIVPGTLNVGIGTRSPSQKLDVAGGINASGGVTAPSFSGDGSGLTNVAASSATTATGLSCTGCVGNTQLGINYAGSASQGGPATSALLSGNSTALGGIAAGNYARLDIGNTFAGNQSVTGNVSVTGSESVGGNLSVTVSATGSLTIGGGTAITEHISVLVDPSFVALKPGACATQNFTLTGAADGDTIALGVPNARMAGGGNLIYTAWVSAADTITVQACNANANSPQKTAGTGSIRVDLWKH